MSIPDGDWREPNGLVVPVLYLSKEDGYVTEWVRVPVETRRGVRRAMRTVGMYVRGEWFHLLPGERYLWISMLDGRIVGIVE